MNEYNVELLPIVESYTAPRRAGREYSARCIFHDDSTASLYINPEKNLFHCFGCGEGGDTLKFVMLAENCSFREALKKLGIDGRDYRPNPEVLRRREEKKKIEAWAKTISIGLRDRLLEIGTDAHVARKVLALPEADHDFLKEEIRRLGREWFILSTLDDDIARNPTEMYEQREDINSLVEEVERWA